MPSFVGTPLQLVLSGGSGLFTPARFSGDPLILVIASGATALGPSLSSGVTGDLSAVLDNLFASESLVDSQGRPTRRFQQIWENTIGAILRALTSQGQSIDELENLWAGINAAQATAATAVQTAQTTQAVINLTDSYPDPPGVLTASSDGSIAIAAHNRVYADGTSIAVNSGSVSGYTAGQTVTVYYQDAARAGGAVAYLGSTSPVAQVENTHVVGAATIPEAGQPAAAGTGVMAPGVISDEQAAAYASYSPRLQ